MRVLSTLLIRRSLLRIGLSATSLPPLIAVAGLLLLSRLVVLAATLTAFTVTLDGSNARVEWEVSTEADVTGFDLARKSPTDPAYTTLSSVLPTGQRRYLLTDRNVYGGGPFTYRLSVRGTPGPEQSYTATLTQTPSALAQTPSAVQRSWGTIKSMFR